MEKHSIIYPNRLVSFENTYRQGPEELIHSVIPDDSIACTTIDGYPEDENESGRVVAEIYLTKNGNVVVAWHDHTYNTNDIVKNLIRESIDALLSEFPSILKTYAQLQHSHPAEGGSDGTAK